MAAKALTSWHEAGKTRSGLREFHYDSDHLKFTGYYHKDKLSFVIDSTCDTIAPDYRLVIQPDPGEKDLLDPHRKWDQIVVEDFGLELENIRPKENNKYQKLDPEYEGLKFYQQIIDHLDDGKFLDALEAHRERKSLENALKREEETLEEFDHSARTLQTSQNTLTSAETSFENIQRRLKRLNELEQTNPAKVDPAKRERAQTSLEKYQTKVKRAERRIRRAEKRHMIAEGELKTTRERITEVKRRVTIRPQVTEEPKRIDDTQPYVAPQYTAPPPSKRPPPVKPASVRERKEQRKEPHHFVLWLLLFLFLIFGLLFLWYLFHGEEKELSQEPLKKEFIQKKTLPEKVVPPLSLQPRPEPRKAEPEKKFLRFKRVKPVVTPAEKEEREQKDTAEEVKGFDKLDPTVQAVLKDIATQQHKRQKIERKQTDLEKARAIYLRDVIGKGPQPLYEEPIETIRKLFFAQDQRKRQKALTIIQDMNDKWNNFRELSYKEYYVGHKLLKSKVKKSAKLKAQFMEDEKLLAQYSRPYQTLFNKLSGEFCKKHRSEAGKLCANMDWHTKNKGRPVRKLQLLMQSYTYIASNE